MSERSVQVAGPRRPAQARGRLDWREASFARDLRDLRDEDATGSPFASRARDVSPEHGGDAADPARR